MLLPPQSLHLLLRRWCAEAAAATVFALAPLPLVLAEAATAAVFARAPPPLVFAEGASATVFALAPHPLVLANTAAAAVFTRAPHPLVLANTAAAAVFTRAPLSLMLADAAATAVLAHVLHATVLAARERTCTPAAQSQPQRRVLGGIDCLVARHSQESDEQHHSPGRYRHGHGSIGVLQKPVQKQLTVLVWTVRGSMPSAAHRRVIENYGSLCHDTAACPGKHFCCS